MTDSITQTVPLMPARHKLAELFDLSGKAAVVTGASQGIGAVIAARLSEAGAAVLVHYRRSHQQAQKIVNAIVDAGGVAAPAQSDLGSAGEAADLMKEAEKHLGRLDILVNNVGSYPTANFDVLTSDEWRAVYQTNVETAFLCSQAAARHIRARGGGTIVNVASVAGLVPSPEQAHYSSAKAALVMLTRSLAQTLGPDGIRVNTISPGLVSRPGIEKTWPDGVARWLGRSPLGRLGEPGDIANACLYLVSPASSWVTGHNLIVDGGVLSAPVY